MKINKHNENAHIGNGKTYSPSFIGGVTDIVTGAEYLLSTQDKLLRPGGGSAYSGFSTDGCYDVENNYMYSVRGPYIIRHDLNTNTSRACTIENANELSLVERFYQSGSNDVGPTEYLILVNQQGDNGSQLFLLDMETLETGLDNPGVPIVKSPQYIDFDGVELHKSADVIGENPGPGWLTDAGTAIPHFLDGVSTTGSVLPFLITNIKCPTEPLGDPSSESDFPSGQQAYRKLFFQIQTLDHDFSFPLHHCVIFEADFTNHSTLEVAWDNTIIRPAFFPMYYFAGNKSVVSSDYKEKMAPSYFFNAPVNWDIDPAVWGLSSAGTADTNDDGVSNNTSGAPGFHSYGADGPNFGNLNNTFDFNNLSQDTVWPFNIIQKAHVHQWVYDIWDFGSFVIDVMMGTYICDFDGNVLSYIFHNSQSGANNDNMETLNFAYSHSSSWLYFLEGGFFTGGAVPINEEAQMSLSNSNNMTQASEWLSADIVKYTEALTNGKVQHFQDQLLSLWYHGSPICTYSKNSLQTYVQEFYGDNDTHDYQRLHAVIGPVDNTGNTEQPVNYWVKYNQLRVRSKIMGESLTANNNAYTEYAEGGWGQDRDVLYVNDAYTVQKNVNNHLQMSVLKIVPGDKLSLCFSTGTGGAAFYSEDDGFNTHSVMDSIMLQTYVGYSSDWNHEFCNIPQISWMNDEEDTGVSVGTVIPTGIHTVVSNWENGESLVFSDIFNDNDSTWPHGANETRYRELAFFAYTRNTDPTYPAGGYFNNYTSLTFTPSYEGVAINRMYASNIAGIMTSVEYSLIDNPSANNLSTRLADGVRMSTLDEETFKEGFSSFHTLTSELNNAYTLELSDTGDLYNPIVDPSVVTTLADIDVEAVPVGAGEVARFVAPFTISYRFSILYDGHQESPLSLDESVVSGAVEVTDDAHQIAVKFMWIEGNLPDRATHVNIYRQYQRTTGEGDVNYKLLKSVSLRPISRWAYNLGVYERLFYDDNEAGVSYEALNGISETLPSTTVNYTFGTAGDSYLFVGGCHVPNTAGDYSNYIFRSMPGNFSQFNWPTDYVILKDAPTAMATFNGRIFAFSSKDTYRINQATLQLEDIFEGVGCVNDESVVVTEYGMCFADNNGIYFHDGSAPNLISDTIATSSSDINANVEIAGGWQDFNKSNIAVSFDAKRKSFLIFFTIGLESGDVNRCWAYNLPRKRWDLLSTEGKVLSTYLNTHGQCLYKTEAGRLFSFMTNQGSTRNWSWHSKEISMGAATQEKKLKKVYLNSNKDIEDENNELSGTCTIVTNGSNDVSPRIDTKTEGSIIVNSYKPTANRAFNKVTVKLDDIPGDTEVSSVGLVYKRKPVK